MMNYFQKKKLAFMSIVNRVKGFMRKVSGVFPLTLPYCVDGKSIIDYTIYGNSVQNGTPTPTTPIEVESVGERTKNLFDIDTATSATDNWYYKVGSYSYGLGLEAGKQYTFSCEILSPPNGFSIQLCRKPDLSDWGYTVVYSFGKILGKHSCTFTADGTECLWFYKDGGMTLNTVRNCLLHNMKDIQLEEGTTATAYEPYGYKIPITVSGKNLFDIDKAENGSIHDLSGDNLEKDNRARTNYIYVKAGTYCVSTISTSGGVRSSTICHTYSTPLETTHIGAVKATSGTILTGTKAYSIFTILVDCYVRFLFLPMSDSSITDLNTNTLNDFKPQIERGDMPTDYEPYHEPITTNIYLDEPLRKVGNYADYVDSENSKVVRNVGKYTFTGNETDMGGAQDDTACVGYVVYISGLSRTNYKRGLCKHVPVYTEASVRGNSRLAFHAAANHPYCYVLFKKADFPASVSTSPSCCRLEAHASIAPHKRPPKSSALTLRLSFGASSAGTRGFLFCKRSRPSRINPKKTVAIAHRIVLKVNGPTYAAPSL